MGVPFNSGRSCWLQKKGDGHPAVQIRNCPRMKKNKSLTCPECQGSGVIKVEPRASMPGAPDLSFSQSCYYCSGYGYQTDENDSFEQFKGRE